MLIDLRLSVHQLVGLVFVITGELSRYFRYNSEGFKGKINKQK